MYSFRQEELKGERRVRPTSYWPRIVSSVQLCGMPTTGRFVLLPSREENLGISKVSVEHRDMWSSDGVFVHTEAINSRAEQLLDVQYPHQQCSERTVHLPSNIPLSRMAVT